MEHIRRLDRVGFKAGALEYGRVRARGELLLVLDADFVAPPWLLREVAGHFRDPHVGMVQVRWEHSESTPGQSLTVSQGVPPSGGDTPPPQLSHRNAAVRARLFRTKARFANFI